MCDLETLRPRTDVELRVELRTRRTNQLNEKKKQISPKRGQIYIIKLTFNFLV